ncbi:CPBP family intramembrane glutamic endopeptidase [Haloimpatiens sp. FM7330]|uniref:CPBP family intramembrane glutamic endopeptidase n=1 Tax=Haloimpatiens sp. FM7330 TaxID=3298610 RepID=UPI00363D3551
MHCFKKYVHPSKAIIISAVSFSLLHSVNIFGGNSVSSTIMQIIFTFIMGLCFAPLALKVKNLYPLIIFHWLWDFVLIAGPITSAKYGIMPITSSIANLIIGIIL